MQYHAKQCNTMQYHASLITADGAYHCPVGSIMAIFIITIIITTIIIIKRYRKSKERPPLLFRQIGKAGRPVRGFHDEVAYCIDVPDD